MLKFERYHRVTKEEKKRIVRIIDKTLSTFKKVKGYAIYGSFVTRNYFRDIDIAIFGKLNERELNKLASWLEKKLGIEIDVKLFDTYPFDQHLLERRISDCCYNDSFLS